VSAVLALLLAAAGPGESTTKADVSNVAYKLKTSGDAVLFEGELSAGASKAFAAVLDGTSGLRRVDLNSIGGLMVEGELVGRLIRERGLDTNVTGVCYSACTHVLLGGVRRTLARGGRIGFHRGYTLKPDVRQRDEEAPYAAIIARSFYEQAKLPSAFIDKVLATPSEAMWKPSRQELIDANVLTPEGAAQKASIAPVPRPASSATSKKR
jgi:hypothetical protein